MSSYGQRSGASTPPIPTSSTPPPALGSAATQAKQDKPSLTGVRIKQRKGQAKATAKFDAESFRDSLLIHLNSLPSPPDQPTPTVDQIVTKLVLAGSQLEFLKYSDQFFEIFFTSGLLQPGGTFVDKVARESDGEIVGEEKRSKVSVFGCNGEGLGRELGSDEEERDVDLSTKGDAWKREVKDVIEILKKLIQRYKYMQRPLDESALPGLLQYLPKFSPSQQQKLAYATCYLIVEGQITGKCLASLYKEGVVKDEVALNFLTTFLQAYISSTTPSPTLENLTSFLRKISFTDPLLVFPNQIRDRAHFEAHFRKHGLGILVDWYVRRVTGMLKEEVGQRLREGMGGEGESVDELLDYLKTQQKEKQIPPLDLVTWIWNAIIDSAELNAKPDQVEQLALKQIKEYSPLLEPFCDSAKVQVGLINVVQVYCYNDTKLLKAFPQIMKVLYNTDCISDQALFYWASKGAAPQGKQNFLKATEPLVKALQAQAEEDESDEE